MAPDMVHRNQRLAHGQRRRLGKVHTHQHRADEAGGIGHGNCVNVPPGQAGFAQRLLSQTVNRFNVLPGGDLRHYAAVNPVQVHLGGDAVRQHLPPIPDDGDGGFIAGGFYRKNVQISHSFPRIRAFSLGFL